MEIYRTFGNKRLYADERLLELNNFLKKQSYFDFDAIDSVIDHKGCLRVNFNYTPKENIEYYYSLFICYWVNCNELNLEFYVKGKLIKTFLL